MPRPDFPRPYTPLTPEIIRRINADQAEYDKDPERWERREREWNEEMDREREEEREEERRQIQRWQSQGED